MRKCASKCAIGGPFAAAIASKPSGPTPLDKYISTRVGETIKAFVETMRDWQATLKDIQILGKQIPVEKLTEAKLPEDLFDNLGLFTICVSHSLPQFCSLCESMFRHNRSAYIELAELIGLGVKIHAYGIARQHSEKVDLHRYSGALNVVSELLKCPDPRDREVRLAPQHVEEGGRLAHALSASMADISLIIFKQMKTDRRNDHVDFLLERTAHIMAEGTRYTEDARKGMRDAFETVYRQMTEQEKRSICQSRFYTRCSDTRVLLHSLMREIDLEILREERASRPTVASAGSGSALACRMR